jgi:uncharacterized protein YndB with AHSA1/START domain
MSEQTTTLTPIRKSVTVRCSATHAFTTFTEGIGGWWPLMGHSMGDEQAQTAGMEPRLGGRVFERWHDGSEHPWGEITAWDPPRRFVMSWKPNPDAPAPTEVEVVFEEENGTTHVLLEHRGWERLGERGPAARASYDGGWIEVLGRFAQATVV